MTKYKDTNGRIIRIGDTLHIWISGFAIGNVHYRRGKIYQNKGIRFKNKEKHISIYPLQTNNPLLSDIIHSASKTQVIQHRIRRER